MFAFYQPLTLILLGYEKIIPLKKCIKKVQLGNKEDEKKKTGKLSSTASHFTSHCVLVSPVEITKADELNPDRT